MTEIDIFKLTSITQCLPRLFDGPDIDAFVNNIHCLANVTANGGLDALQVVGDSFKTIWRVNTEPGDQRLE